MHTKNTVKKLFILPFLALFIASSLSIAAYALSELSVSVSISGAGRYISILGGDSVAITDTFALDTDAVAFNATALQEVNIGLAADDGYIAVTNPTASAGAWTLAIAASAPTAKWSNDGASLFMDFNDADTGADGVDTDTVGGRLTIDMTSAAVTALGSGGTTGVTSPGDVQSFAEGTKDSITLMAGGETAEAASAWKLTGIDFIQIVPAAQAAETYTIDLTLTLT